MSASSKSPLENLARRKLSERRRSGKAADVSQLPLLDFIELVSKKVSGPYGGLQAPHPLARVAGLYDRIEAGEPVWALVSTPPQHGKTSCELYGATRHLLRHPDQAVALVTYEQRLALKFSYHAKLIAEAAGLHITGHALSEWRTDRHGSFLATSVSGPLTGHPALKLILVDDPYKGRAEAESALERAKVRDWMSGSVIARAHPDTSIIVTHTRWHEDDLIGFLSKWKKADGTPRFEHINLPAINEAGEALWPELHPVEELNERRRNEYDWWSMYMGSPRPKGGALFQDTYFFDRLPDGYRVSIGVDLAYTAKTHADYSVAVVLAEKAGLYYVLDVVRLQVAAPLFGQRLKMLQAAYPGAPMTAYAYGPEKGNIDWLRKEGLRIWGKSMSGDKHARAQPVAGAWNAGKILLPRTRGALDPSLPPSHAQLPPEWLDEFVSELASFSGINDPHDDQVDALAPAYDRISPRKGDTGGPVGAVSAGISIDDREMG